MFFTPLEQFEIILLLKLFFCNYFDISISNIVIFLILVNFLILFFFYLNVMYYPKFISVKAQIVPELIYNFILNLIKQQTNSRGLRFFPLYFYIFLFILISNLVGLVPYSFTITSQFAITFIIALSINVGLLIFGFLFHNIRFLKFFIPKGVPILLLPLIILIEIFSYLIRTFSLSVRLFCNMTAGHTLLHMITSFGVLFLNNSSYVVLIFITLLILAIYLLEFGIAFIQAYVFLILISIYLNDSIVGGH